MLRGDRDGTGGLQQDGLAALRDEADRQSSERGSPRLPILFLALLLPRLTLAIYTYQH